MGRFCQNLFIGLLSVAFCASQSHAANDASQTFTLDGQLFHVGSTSPLVDSGAQLKVQILDPSQTCVLYEETQNVNTSATEGFFTLQVGSLPGSGKRTGLDPAQTMSSIIQNILPIPASSAPGQTCTSYTPSAGDTRYFRITVIPSSGSPDTLTPDMVLDSVPSAIVAQSVEGLDRGSILHTNTTTPAGETLTQANLESLFTASAFANLTAVASGQYVQSGTGGANLPSFAVNPAAPAAGDIWYNSATQNLVYSDGSTSHILGTAGAGVSSLTVTARLTANGVAGGTLSGPGTIDLNSVGTAGTYVKVTTDAYGRVTGNSLLAETDIPALSTAGKVSGTAINAGAIGGSASINTSGNLQTTGDITTQRFFIYDHAGVGPNYVGMTVPADLTSAGGASYIMTWPDRKGAANQVLTTDNTGQLSWTTPSTTDTSKVAKAGDTMTGPLNNNSNSASTALAVTQAGGGYAATFMGGKVGIGNTSPTGLLTVGDTASSYVTTDSTGSSSSVNLAYAGASRLTLSSDGNVSFPSMASSNYGAVRLGDGVSSYGYISGANSNAVLINPASGNVGINTFSPSSSLDINGAQTIEEIAAASKPAAAAGKDFIYADSVSHTLKVSLNGGAYVDLLTASSGSSNYVAKTGDTMTGPLNNNSNSASTALAVTQAGSGYAATFTGGNVGIGTTSPASILDINGAQTIREIAAASAPAITAGEDFIYADSVSHTLKVSLNGGAYADLLTGAAASGSYIKIDGSTPFTGDQSMGSHKLTNVTDPASAQDAATRNYVDTKLIGKTLPTAPAAGQNGQALRWNNATLAWEYYTPTGGTGTVTNITAGTGLNVGAGPGGSLTTTGTLNVNVGVGASQIVQLDGSSRLPAVDGSLLTNLDAGQIATGLLALARGGTGTALAPAGKGEIIYSNSTTTMASLVPGNSGYVLTSAGVGAAPVWSAPSTTDSSKVAKAGDTMTGPLNNNSSSSSTALAVAQSGSGYAASFSGGNVGIGTSSPQSPLHVINGAPGTFSPVTDETLVLQRNGSAAANAVMTIVAGTSGDSIIRLTSSSNAEAGKIGYNNSTNALYFFTNASEKMRIDQAGNLGIGTTVPNAKLQVVGAMVSTPNQYGSATATVDLSLSNTQTLSSVSGTTIALSNMVSGGVYNIIIEDTASHTYTFTGCNNSYFKPANGATTAGTRTVYGILTVQKPGPSWDCYISWSTGFN